MRPDQKKLIDIPDYVRTQLSGQGIRDEAIIMLPSVASVNPTGSFNATILNDLKALSGLAPVAASTVIPSTSAASTTNIVDTESANASNIKKYIPYIIGIALIGIIIYFVVKK
jgi:hypothetical protein